MFCERPQYYAPSPLCDLSIPISREAERKIGKKGW